MTTIDYKHPRLTLFPEPRIRKHWWEKVHWFKLAVWGACAGLSAAAFTYWIWFPPLYRVVFEAVTR